MVSSLKRIAIAAYKILFQFVSILPRKQKLIIFESFLGKQYSCNPRAIYEYLKVHHPEYELIWSVDPALKKALLIKGYLSREDFRLNGFF